jgi:hypothetical protein
MLPGMVCVRGLRGALDTLSEVGGSGIKPALLTLSAWSVFGLH